MKKILALAALLTACSNAVTLPDPAVNIKTMAKGKQRAVFAGGCFWCTEAVFEQLNGVEKVISGYAGGDKASAHYNLVGEGKTEHAEAIEITFDPAKITYGQLLKVFFSTAHDPTTLNRQGPDFGRQYRSAVFYVDAEQKQVTDAYIKQLTDAGSFKKPIVTQVNELKMFYPAEDYHQDFVKLNPRHGYVVVNALPKIEKTRKEFPNLVHK